MRGCDSQAKQADFGDQVNPQVIVGPECAWKLVRHAP